MGEHRYHTQFRWFTKGLAMAHGQLQMTKEQMAEGLARGRTLTQEEWAHPNEIKWLDELIAEGKAKVTREWSYHDNFQCSFRKVTGVVQ